MSINKPALSSKLLSKNIFMSTGAFIFGKICSFLVTISLAKIFAPNIIGIISFANAMSGIIFMLLKFGLENYILREVSKEPEKANDFFNKTFTLNVISILVSSFLFITFVLIFLNSNLEKKVLIFVFLATVLGLITEISIAYFKVFYKVIYEVYTRLTYRISLVFIVLPIIFVFKSIDLYLIAILGLSMVIVIMAILFVRYGLNFNIKFTDLKISFAIISKSYPLMMVSVVVFILVQLDIIMLKLIVGNYGTGIYKIASIFYFPFAMISATIMSVILPILSKYYKSDEKMEFMINKIFKFLLLISLLFVYIITILYEPFIDLFFKGKYNESITALNILIWSLVPYYLDMLTSYTLIAKGYEKYVLRSNIYAIIVSLIFNVVLITKFNILGAAMATLIAMTIRCLSNMVYLKKSGVFYSNILKIILFLAVSVLNLLTLRFYFDSILINLSSTIFILAILVLCFSIITKDDIIDLKENLISKI